MIHIIIKNLSSYALLMLIIISDCDSQFITQVTNMNSEIVDLATNNIIPIHFLPGTAQTKLNISIISGNMLLVNIMNKLPTAFTFFNQDGVLSYNSIDMRGTMISGIVPFDKNGGVNVLICWEPYFTFSVVLLITPGIYPTNCPPLDMRLKISTNIHH